MKTRKITATLAIILSVALLGACSEVDLQEESPLEKDLALVATKAMAAVQPDWGKVKIDPIPIVPTPLPPVPPPVPVDPADTEESTFNSALLDFVETVWPVMKKHGAIEEYLAQNNSIDIEEFYDEDGRFLFSDFSWSTTSNEFQFLFHQIVVENTCAYTVADLANDGGLNTFEKITLAYFMGYGAVTEMDDLIETKSPSTKYEICRVMYLRHRQQCETEKNTLKALAMFNSVGALCLESPETASCLGTEAVWTAISSMGLFETIKDNYTLCLQYALDNYRKCLEN